MGPTDRRARTIIAGLILALLAASVEGTWRGAPSLLQKREMEVPASSDGMSLPSSAEPGATAPESHDSAASSIATSIKDDTPAGQSEQQREEIDSAPNQNDEEIALNDGSVHICIFSDRVDGLKSTLKSTALNAEAPEKIHIWIVTDNTESVETAAEYLQDTKLHVHALKLDKVVSGILDQGYKPVWTWDVYNSSVKDDKANWDPSWANDNTARPGKWDHSTMHMHPLNHLRFYIPYIKEFTQLDRIIFMDDDLIIQGDVQRAWDAKQNLTEGKVLVGACEIWKWGDEMSAFQYSGRNSSYAKSSALAMVGRKIDETFCKTDEDVWCVGKNHWENLNRRHLEINGKPFEPESQPEWNFGFTLFDLEEWRILNLTTRYEKWMHANYDDHIFPETSLMYGLGIPFLTYYDSVACWDDVTEPKILLRDGFGYISYPEFAFNGLNTTYLTTGFVLHYDGWLKPWYDKADPIFKIPWEKTMAGVKAEDYKGILEDPETVRSRLDIKQSFVILSDPRSGSEWFRSVLDQNPQVCVGGTSGNEGGRTGFPSDILLPYDKGPRFFRSHKEKMRMSCYWAFIDRWVPLVQRMKDKWCTGNLPEKARPLRRHMPSLCAWAKRLSNTSADKAALFDDYLGQVLAGSGDLWSCRCPKTSKAAGVRILTDWIGQSFDGRLHKNLDSLDTDAVSSASISSSVPSFWRALEKANAKVIFFRRSIVNEVVSKHIAAATGIHHATNEQEKKLIEEKAKTIKLPPRITGELIARAKHRSYITSRLNSMDSANVLILDYEECIEDLKACFGQVETFLGVESFGYDYNTFRHSKIGDIQKIIPNYNLILDILKEKNITNLTFEEKKSGSLQNDTNTENQNELSSFLMLNAKSKSTGAFSSFAKNRKGTLHNDMQQEEIETMLRHTATERKRNIPHILNGGQFARPESDLDRYDHGDETLSARSETDLRYLHEFARSKHNETLM